MNDTHAMHCAINDKTAPPGFCTCGADLPLQDIATLAAKHGMAVVPVLASEGMLRAARTMASPQSPWEAYNAMIEFGRIKPE